MYTEQQMQKMVDDSWAYLEKIRPDYYKLITDAGYKVRVNTHHSRNCCGVTDHVSRTIDIAYYTLCRSVESEIVDTVRHEFAHAIDFLQRNTTTSQAHDKIWKAIAKRVGAKPYARATVPIPKKYMYIICSPEHHGLAFIAGYNKTLPKGTKQGVDLGEQGWNNGTGCIILSWSKWAKACKKRGLDPYEAQNG